ncbi:ferredoxin--NADP reductase [uncultured Thiodictyon sp.]|uniref:ferredoxin--NADP reductase n=1 Tax=uncultured Thiodictyon sp. TaxID=1846217 RepID=UPI0025FC07A2|nr:ferredoxin--NADP reductase [uncultured Thiodictyon sp.]
MASEWVKGTVVGKHTWAEGLYSIQVEAPVADFRAGQFVKIALDIAGERVGRPYSLVNPPSERPLEFLFNEMPGGPLTPSLSVLNPGDAVWVSAQAGGIFTLEAVAPAANLWLLATGTGIGVYLSILRTPDPWERFERVILVHGVRSGADLVYGETIAALAARWGERFTFVPVVSREFCPQALGGRITDALTGGELEARVGARIESAFSHVMLCGNASMIKDVKQILEARGMVRHRRNAPGQYSTEHYH